MPNHTITTLRTLLEADNRLRDLERKWKTSGTVEDEIAYLRERVRAKKGIELSDLSVEFTRWKEARKWFREIYATGNWATIFRLNGRPMHQVTSEIVSVLTYYLASRTRSKNVPAIQISVLGWRAHQAPGFNVYFHHMFSEMCASLWARPGGIDWQAVNQNCLLSHLNSTGAATHKDSILLSTPGAGDSVWQVHIRAGK